MLLPTIFFHKQKNILQCAHNWFKIFFSSAFSQEISSNLPMFHKQVHIFREKEIELVRMLLQKGFDPLVVQWDCSLSTNGTKKIIQRCHSKLAHCKTCIENHEYTYIKAINCTAFWICKLHTWRQFWQFGQKHKWVCSFLIDFDISQSAWYANKIT